MLAENFAKQGRGRRKAGALQGRYLRPKLLDPSQVEEQVGHSDAVPSCFLQSCHNHTHAAFAFGEAEFTLNLDTLALINVILFFVNLSVLFRSAESGSRKPDVTLLAVAKIVTVAVDFVHQNVLGIMSCSLLEFLNHIL